MKIVIIGGGISGLTAAHLLCGEHEITLFEAGDYLGGHTNTLDVPHDGITYAIDTGFIVFNERTYPNFIKLLDRLGVPSQPSVMSFSAVCQASGLQYSATNLDTLFAQRKNLLWIYAELGLNAAVIFGVFFVFDIFALKWHVTLMITGHCLSAFFAVWSVHRGCNSPDFPARTLRGKLKNLLFYNMFFHFEHHLFPQVPTCHLPILAQRIDKAGIRNYELVF